MSPVNAVEFAVHSASELFLNKGLSILSLTEHLLRDVQEAITTVASISSWRCVK